MKNGLYGLVAVVSLFCIENCAGMEGSLPPSKHGASADFNEREGMLGLLEEFRQTPDDQLYPLYDRLGFLMTDVMVDKDCVNSILDRLSASDARALSIKSCEKPALIRLSKAYNEIQKQNQNQINSDHEFAVRLAQQDALQDVVLAAREHGIEANLTRLGVPKELHPAAIAVLDEVSGVTVEDIAAFFGADPDMSSEDLFEYFLTQWPQQQ